MRILWLNHFIPYPPKGGALQRSHHLLRQAAARHEVHLVALNQPALLRQATGGLTEATAVLGQFCRSVRIFPIPAESSRARRMVTASAALLRTDPYDVYWLHSRALARYLRTLVAHEAFDLVHVDTLGLVPYTLQIPTLPMVLNHHNVESHMMARRAQAEPKLLRRAYFTREARKLERFERSVAGRFAANIVVSELDAQRLKSVTGDVNTFVVDNGADTDYFVPHRPLGHGEGSIIFAGRLNWYPNLNSLRLLLGAIWPALVADRPGRRLTVVGNNPPSDLLEAAAADPRITVTGFVEDVRPYLDDASIYICPILDGGGTRLKILDALAMAKPLVATGMAVEGLGLVDGEHYARAETPREFVDKIRQLEGDETLRQRLGRAGRQIVEQQFSWHCIGQKLENAYAAAVRTTAAGSAPAPVGK